VKKSPLICVLVLSFVGTANAVITFSEYPTGTAVSNQYAAQGVLFTGGTKTPGLPIIDPDGAMPGSPILRPAGGVGTPYTTYQGDFWMQFTAPVYTAYYWLDRLLVADRSAIASRWPFALGLTILLLGFIFWVLSRPKVRQFYQISES